jgi:transposase
MHLHIRKKKNPSGSISVQIIDRRNRGYKVVETIGCAKNDIELELLISKAKEKLKSLQPTLFDLYEEEKDEKEEILGKKVEFIDIDNDIIFSIGGELIFGKIIKDLRCKDYFKKVKIRKIEKRFEYFKDLVISRILYQGSKLYFIDYRKIFRRKNDISVYSVYRLLDKLYSTKLKDELEKCVFNHTLKLINNQLIITFYDVTTLHFESESEDDLRKIGFSKEGKLNRPQIQIGLLTTIEGYPLGYEIYEGNKFEGHTLIESLKAIEEKFNLKQKPIIVADRGMLNNCNLIELDNNGYKYIIGARIKSLKEELKSKIASLNFKDENDTKEIILNETLTCNKKNNQERITIKKDISQRLILSYSIQRMKKDKYLREKAIEKLEKRLNDSIKFKKSDLKLSPYAKFIDLETKSIRDDNCQIVYKINEEKIKLDEKLDGIKGYITNDFTLSHKEIISHYANLYNIEKAFRISKTDLKIRPVYHRLENRIKAHILISFIAYAVYKEFERRIKVNKLDLPFSYKILMDLITNMKAIENENKFQLLKFNKYQNLIYNAVFNS